MMKKVLMIVGIIGLLLVAGCTMSKEGKSNMKDFCENQGHDKMTDWGFNGWGSSINIAVECDGCMYYEACSSYQKCIKENKYGRCEAVGHSVYCEENLTYCKQSGGK